MIEPWFVRDPSKELLASPKAAKAMKATGACSGCHTFRKQFRSGGNYTVVPALIEPITDHACLEPANCTCPECGFYSNKFYEDTMEDLRQEKLLKIKMDLDDVQGQLNYMIHEGYSAPQIVKLQARLRELQTQLDMAND